jgi:transposase
VELVEEQGQALSKVVKKLKIKLTTARLIITKYRQTGEFPMRDFKKRGIKERLSSPHHPFV